MNRTCIQRFLLVFAVGLALSVVFNAFSTAPRRDETVPADYLG